MSSKSNEMMFSFSVAEAELSLSLLIENALIGVGQTMTLAGDTASILICSLGGKESIKSFNVRESRRRAIVDWLSVSVRISFAMYSPNTE